MAERTARDVLEQARQEWMAGTPGLRETPLVDYQLAALNAAGFKVLGREPTAHMTAAEGSYSGIRSRDSWVSMWDAAP